MVSKRQRACSTCRPIVLRRLILVMAALSVVVMALSHGSHSPELPPVVDTSPYGAVESVDPGGEPFPGSKSYRRPPKHVGVIADESDLFAAWYAYFEGDPRALEAVSSQRGEPPKEDSAELNLADMLDAITACAYGEIKDCG